MSRLTHFNIQNSKHKPGRNYLIVKIHKRGYFDGKIGKAAILESNNFILAKCISSHNNINYNDLKRKIFKYSLSKIKNVNYLRKAIMRRYKKTLVHLSNAEKLSLGLGITELKIIKRL